jgi:hypothetical protein
MAELKCFLSYSSGYDHLKEPFRRLLEALGFTVDVFDGPDMDAVEHGVLRRMRSADAVVVLYGPREKPTSASASIEPAKWPHEEALTAMGMGKPIAMIMHGNMPPQGLLRALSTPARFDFWDSNSFLSQVHNVVRHILSFRERLNVVSDTGNNDTGIFKYKLAIARHRVQSGGINRHEVYHEVVAKQACGVFFHCVDSAGDDTMLFPPPEQLKYELKKQRGPDALKLSLKFGRCTPHEIAYFVEVSPGLQPGEELGYWRSFDLPNTFPLSRAEIAQRAGRPGFPAWLPPNTYAHSWDVVYDIVSLTYAIHFPWDVEIARHDVRVMHHMTREENAPETLRCKPLLRFHEDPASSERIIEITVPEPKLNHSYYLLYEPKK